MTQLKEKPNKEINSQADLMQGKDLLSCASGEAGCRGCKAFGQGVHKGSKIDY
jgi:hypothetical protein